MKANIAQRTSCAIDVLAGITTHVYSVSIHLSNINALETYLFTKPKKYRIKGHVVAIQLAWQYNGLCISK